MKKEKTRNTSVLDNGLVVTWYDDSLPSLETIEETTTFVELKDYLDVLLIRNMDKKK